jgi:hypothetical protein
MRMEFTVVFDHLVHIATLDRGEVESAEPSLGEARRAPCSVHADDASHTIDAQRFVATSTPSRPSINTCRSNPASFGPTDAWTSRRYRVFRN